MRRHCRILVDTLRISKCGDFNTYRKEYTTKTISSSRYGPSRRGRAMNNSPKGAKSAGPVAVVDGQSQRLPVLR